MPGHVADMAIKELNRAGKVIRDSKVLIMGLTYKENVPDTRESPVSEMIHELKGFDVDVYGYDPLLSDDQIEGFGFKARAQLDYQTWTAWLGRWPIRLQESVTE